MGAGVWSHGSENHNPTAIVFCLCITTYDVYYINVRKISDVCETNLNTV